MYDIIMRFQSGERKDPWSSRLTERFYRGLKRSVERTFCALTSNHSDGSSKNFLHSVLVSAACPECNTKARQKSRDEVHQTCQSSNTHLEFSSRLAAGDRLSAAPTHALASQEALRVAGVPSPEQSWWNAQRIPHRYPASQPP